MKSHMPFVLLLVAVIFVSGCVYGKTSAQPPAGNPNTVAIKDFAFSPSTLTIKALTTVTWANHDSAPHTATSESGVFDSGQIPAGSSYSRLFDKPGTYEYICSIHPSMKGTIIVGQ